LRTVLNRLGSIKITLTVLLLIAGVAAIGTFLPQGGSMEAWEKLVGTTGTRAAVTLGLTDFYHSIWFISLLAILVLNMLACMTNRVPGMLSSLSGKAAMGRKAVLELSDTEETTHRVVSALESLGFRVGTKGKTDVYSRGSWGYLFTVMTHGSILIIMASSIVGSTAGFIATQRIYVGESSKTAYNWKDGGDRPLPFEISVKDLAILPNPVGVRLGVLETATGRKGKLITTHEGGAFKVPGLDGRFQLVSFNAEDKSFSASWTRPDGSTTAVRSGEEIANTGLSLVPVAYATWPERQVTTQVTVVSGGAGEIPGEISVNHPMVTAGIRIYLTDYGRDRFGLPYVGFQFVRDPGQAGVWIGSVLFLVCVTGAVFFRHSCAVLVREEGWLLVHLSSRENREEIMEKLQKALLPGDDGLNGDTSEA
jgi:cytochrome c biogenesis protein